VAAVILDNKLYREPGKGCATPDQLPAIIPPTTLATPTDTSIMAPAVVADLGDTANWRYVEFFTANINNDRTGRAYARACSRFSPSAKIAGSRSRPFGRSTLRPG
jgi:hypothetical protein